MNDEEIADHIAMEDAIDALRAELEKARGEKDDWKGRYDTLLTIWAELRELRGKAVAERDAARALLRECDRELNLRDHEFDDQEARDAIADLRARIAAFLGDVT